MKIALAIQHFPPYPGGAERQARLLARRLKEATVDCDVITTRHDRGLPWETREGGLRIVRLPTFGSGAVRLAVNALAAFGYFAIRGRRYQVVHAHCLSPFALGALLGARLRGCGTVLKVCTMGLAGDIAKVRRGLLGALLWRGFGTADRWVAASPAVYEEARAHLATRARVALIPNGVEVARTATPAPGGDASPPRDPRAVLGLPERGVCVFAGRLVPGKGLDAIMEAWPRIHAASPATLVIVGDGPLATELRAWAEAPAQAGSVRLVGWQSDLSPFYASADVLFFPSASEAFGNVLAEAMAHGVAAITTPVGLAGRWAHDRGNALVVQGPDRSSLVTALARAAIELLADDALRATLGERARATALECFASDAVVHAYLDLYRDILATRVVSHPEPSRPSPMGTSHA
jgi:glycosyltransferase involved in cell wall biosynthesis